ncbi:UMP-CMP kinase 2, mitochondrial [Trypanosoma grayi]|uniref:UMP-CMP kinase 2, mitochondrial n=1 Tax=Trypanosoma grayi TaxID=71804 RepID=UPI0004F4685E|nr:UMP-CMP kinase 2, mitochondrial [Trypanosoma grayi]KEG10161.1 UMP-CMP kinase 2, mitochondrial [Trypanosoma grayi]
MVSSVYSSRAACVGVLRTVEQRRPAWWTPACTDFLRRVERLPPTGADDPAAAAPRSKVLLVVEGLDGVGKSLVTQSLVDRLGASAELLRTPDPALHDLREIFRAQDEDTSRAFYSAANYLAAWEALHATGQRRFIVFDRWWCSTCAMALANRCVKATLPPVGDAVYQWPRDLPTFDVGALLQVDESIRLERIRRRAPEDAEERRLSAQLEMRETAMEAYRRFGLLTEVHTPTYGVAVNSILALMTRRGVQHNATPFTAAELAAIRPF